MGCGNVRLPDYVNIDIVPTPATDLVADITNLSMFADSSVAEIRMSAVIEHLFRHERLTALREWIRVLKPGGHLRIDFVPDFDVIARQYVDRAPGVTRERFDLHEVYRYTHGDPVPWNAPEQIHKDLFTRDSLESDFREAGYVDVQCSSVVFHDEPVAISLNVLGRKPS